MKKRILSLLMAGTIIFSGIGEVSMGKISTVSAAEYSVMTEEERLEDSGISPVALTDAYLVNAAEKENDYLTEQLSAKKLLYQFYVTSGLTPPTQDYYQGWERPSGSRNFRGHTLGHYMSALAQAYSGTSDVEQKAALLQQIKDAVEGLRECQDAYGQSHPGSAGYVSAFAESALDAKDGTGTTTDTVLVPWYNLHKVLAGLLDIYTYVDDTTIQINNKALAAEALEIAEKFSEYVYMRCSRLENNEKLLAAEYGGMNEALYEIYDITGNNHFKTAAQYFDEVKLFEELAAGNDVLAELHANTTIPKLIGALKRYTVLTKEKYSDNLTEKEKEELDMYFQAAKNFWNIVIEDHTYVTGGNSQREHFHKAGELYYDAVETTAKEGGSTTCETCNVYNMLKLTRELYKITGDKKYMDYYENAYINSILSSQNPETGMTTYFQAMASGYNKVFSNPTSDFWCCTGTGMENFSKLGDTMYFTKDTDVYVNMYFSNIFQYEEQNLKLIQTANMPDSDEVMVKVEALDTGAVKEGTTLRFRIPDWTVENFWIKKNDEVQSMVENGYAVVPDVRAGDVITLKFPMEVKAYNTKDKANFIAFKYGPVVLSADLGDTDSGTGTIGVQVRWSKKNEAAQSVIRITNMSVEEWMEKAAENLTRMTEKTEDGQIQFQLQNTDSPELRYTPHYKRYQGCYGLYMLFEEAVDSPMAQERILKNKQILRTQENTTDSLEMFDENNFEIDKNLQSDKSSVGLVDGRRYRKAEKNGYFSFDMAIDPEAEHNYLSCTYNTEDAGNNFDIYVNDTLLKTVTVKQKGENAEYYTDSEEIPAGCYATPKYKKDTEGKDVLDDNGNKIPVVTVKFVGKGVTEAGRLFGISTLTQLDYKKNAELSDLTFKNGKLEPEFDPAVKAYTLYVPESADTVVMNAKPNVPSGLVYVGDILIDDTIDRTITLNPDGDTPLLLTAKAQDHETAVVYSIIVKKDDEKSGLYEVKESDYVTIDENTKKITWDIDKYAENAINANGGNTVNITENTYDGLNGLTFSRKDTSAAGGYWIKTNEQNVTIPRLNLVANGYIRFCPSKNGLLSVVGGPKGTKKGNRYICIVDEPDKIDVENSIINLNVTDNTIGPVEKGISVEAGKMYYIGGDLAYVMEIIYQPDLDKSALEAKIAEAEKIDSSKYTKESCRTLQDALVAAKAVLSDKKATQEQVNQAEKMLQNAIDGLVIVPLEMTKPGTPTEVKASWAGKKGIYITWKAVLEADSYTVYSSYKQSSGYTKIATVKRNFYTDAKAKTGKTVYYKVVANRGNVKSSFSKAISSYALATPSKVKASAKQGYVTLRFRRVAKASGYQVSYSTKKNGKYKSAGTIKAGKVRSVRKTFKVKKKGTYYYIVRAYKSLGRKKIYTDYCKTVKVKVK